jgi:hypothetical protein
MNCRKAIRQLPAHLDHELSEADAKELEAHLRVCVFCSTELSALRATSKMLDSWRAVLPQRCHAAAVIKEIRAEEQGIISGERMRASSWASRLPSVALRAAAVLVFLMGSILFYGRLPVNEQTKNVASGALENQESLRRLMSLDADVRRSYIKPSEFWLALRGLEQPARPVPADSWEASVRQATRDSDFPGGVEFPAVEHIYFPGDEMPVESIIPVGGTP